MILYRNANTTLFMYPISCLIPKKYRIILRPFPRKQEKFSSLQYLKTRFRITFAKKLTFLMAYFLSFSRNSKHQR